MGREVLYDRPPAFVGTCSSVESLEALRTKWKPAAVGRWGEQQTGNKTSND